MSCHILLTCLVHQIVETTLKQEVLETTLYIGCRNTNVNLGSPFSVVMPKGCSCAVCSPSYSFFIIVTKKESKGGGFPSLSKKDRKTWGDNVKNYVYIVETEVIIKEFNKRMYC